MNEMFSKSDLVLILNNHKVFKNLDIHKFSKKKNQKGLFMTVGVYLKKIKN